jgi:tetratricopeptide (TPR) repeat protein
MRYYSLMARIIFAVFLSIYPGLSAELRAPYRTAATPTPKQVALVSEGLVLNGQRNFEAAIAKYRQVLAQNPWEVNALAELALTYSTAKDYRSALGTARLGAQCDSPRLADFYTIIADSLEHLGRAKEATEAHKAAEVARR